MNRYLLLLLSGLILLSPASAQCDQSVEEIRDRFQHRLKQIQGMKLNWREELDCSNLKKLPRFVDQSSGKKVDEIQWHQDGQKFHFQSTPIEPLDRNPQVTTSNGKKIWQFSFIKAKEEPFLINESDYDLEWARGVQINIGLDWYLGFAVLGSTDHSLQYLSIPEFLTLGDFSIQGNELIDGIDCVVLESAFWKRPTDSTGYQIKYWFDANANLRKAEYTNEQYDSPIDEYTLGEFKAISTSNGIVHFPHRIVRWRGLPGNRMKKTTEFSNVELNRSLPASSFEVPPDLQDAIVSNRDPKESQERRLELTRIHKQEREQQSDRSTVNQSFVDATPRRSQTWRLWLALAGSACLICAFLITRK